MSAKVNRALIEFVENFRELRIDYLMTFLISLIRNASFWACISAALTCLFVKMASLFVKMASSSGLLKIVPIE